VLCAAAVAAAPFAGPRGDASDAARAGPRGGSASAPAATAGRDGLDRGRAGPDGSDAAAIPRDGVQAAAPSPLGGLDAAARAERFILTRIRIPRVLLAAVAGAALACTGAAFQALFRNPLATPYTLGVASGAAFGAVTAILLGSRLPFGGTGAGTAGALAGAAAVTGLAWLLGRRRGGLPTTTLLLAGVTLSFLFSALVLLLQYVADFTQAFRILRWLLGEVRVVGYAPFGVLAPLALVGGLLVLRRREELHVLAAGEELARARGVELRGVTRAVFFGSSALVGGVVALCGPIGFVGLVVPHALRRVLGPDLRVVLPACVPAGAAFLVLCDTVARTVLAPVEIPVGVVTALLGGPFFLAVLLRTRTHAAA
jgi:iron complex transport system permease protein